MNTTGKTMGLAEWIIDNTCLVLFVFVLTIVSFHRILPHAFHKNIANPLAMSPEKGAFNE